MYLVTSYSRYGHSKTSINMTKYKPLHLNSTISPNWVLSVHSTWKIYLISKTGFYMYITHFTENEQKQSLFHKQRQQLYYCNGTY